MEWGFILVMALAIPILFWVALIWAGVFCRLPLLIRDIVRQRTRVWGIADRLVRAEVIIIVPVAIYAVLVWFFFSTFGWVSAVIVAVALPVIALGLLLGWVAVVSGLYQVARDSRRRRVVAPRRRAIRPIREQAF